MEDHMGKVSLKTVAAEAGVSVATVSYVLNGKENKVSAETRDKVREVIERLGYVPNGAARNLKKRSSRCIGLVILEKLHKEAPRVYNAMLTQIQYELEKEDYQIIINSNKITANGYPDYINAYLEGRIDAVVYVGSEAEDASEAAAWLKRYLIPAVFLDCREDYSGFSNIRIGYEQTMSIFCDYLFGKIGVQNMMFLRGNGWYRQEIENIQEKKIREKAAEYGAELCVTCMEGMQNFNAIENLVSQENAFEKWKDLAVRCGNIADTVRENQFLLCSVPILAESMLPQLARRNMKIRMGAEGEFSLPPTVLFSMSPGTEVYISNVQKRRLCILGAHAILECLKSGETENLLVTSGRIQNFSS